jgi:hypothetical protein
MIAGHKIDIQLASHEFHQYDTFGKLQDAYGRGGSELLPWGKQGGELLDELERVGAQFHALRGIGSKIRTREMEASGGRGKRPRQSYWCSAAGHLDLRRQLGMTEIRNFGGLIFVPMFGCISVGELLVEESSRQMVMLRLYLESPVEGNIVAGSVEIGSDKSGALAPLAL